MTYTFRHRMELARPGLINLDEPELALTNPDEEPKVVLSTGESGRSLRDVPRVVLLGSGYPTQDDAEHAGLAWRSVLERVFAYGRVGADFGDRAAKGVVTNAGIRMFEQTSGGQRFLNDDHGLMVYESEPPPRFIRMGPASMVVSISEVLLRRAFTASEARVPTTTQESTAFDLFSASFMTGSVTDARFMLLMMAIESLIEQQPRDDETQRHIDGLIASTRQARLSDRQKDSIIGSLEALRLESISQAGQSLVASLGNRTYNALSPAKLFRRCYKVRSDLVHGRIPRPTSQEVGSLAASLEMMVSHLIAGPSLLQAMNHEQLS
jgi:hypothetical protein